MLQFSGPLTNVPFIPVQHKGPPVLGIGSFLLQRSVQGGDFHKTVLSSQFSHWLYCGYKTGEIKGCIKQLDKIKKIKLKRFMSLLLVQNYMVISYNYPVCTNILTWYISTK